jgi:hypothetical protein
LDEQRKSNWEKNVEKTSFTHSIRKAWNLLKKLGTDAHQTVPSKTVIADPDLAANFNIPELEAALKSVKTENAAGLDGIFPEFILNCGDTS